MSGFLQRLKERKLAQWAIAYVAAGFALLQGIDIVAQRFGWPESIERALIVALAIGFFVTIVLAWYHGERGAQRLSGTELNADQAFAWLEKALQHNDGGLTEVVSQPMFAPIRDDPRWLPFLRKIGRAPEQLAAIPFNVTLPQ